jgi:hypothetical protein
VLILKKTTALIMLVLLTAFVFIPSSAVLAGGDKNRGEIGEGDTFENGCEDQPCFAYAPMPGPSEVAEIDSGLEDEIDEKGIAGLIFIFKLLAGGK